MNRPKPVAYTHLDVYKRQEEALATESLGDGVTVIRRMDKRVPARERVRAAELMAKRYGLFADRVDLNAESDLHITVDYGH